MAPTEQDLTRDWRGTKIEVGDTVIYGGPVGRSIQMVEGEVIGFTPAGRVNVRILRRAYSHAYYGDKRVVHVGHDRLTVLKDGVLPPTEMPTWDEAITESERIRQERDANYGSHVGPESEWYEMPPAYPGGYVGHRQRALACQRCGAIGILRGAQRCTDG